MFVTIFELIFYVYIISPTIISAVEYSLSTNTITDNQLYQIIDILNKREHLLIDTINYGSYYVIGIEIVLLFCVLLYLYTRISIISKDVKYKDVIVSSSITICSLLCFQILFYNFGINYWYMGKFGPNEAINRFIQHF